MTRFLLICLAGALGTGVRYLVAIGCAKLFGTGFPWGTLVVNVVGSFLITGIAFVALRPELLSATARLALTTGFLGGLTTYSAFNHETLSYFGEKAWGLGLLYMGVTVILCLGAGRAGVLLAEQLFRDA